MSRLNNRRPYTQHTTKSCLGISVMCKEQKTNGQNLKKKIPVFVEVLFLAFRVTAKEEALQWKETHMLDGRQRC